MRRSPNITISQWFRQNNLLDRPWVQQSSCGARQDLPWVADARPTPQQMDAMYDTCIGCPVIRQCAAYAIDTHVGGGFYAGVWLPWVSPTESADTKLMRAYARRRLRRIAR